MRNLSCQPQSQLPESRTSLKKLILILAVAGILIAGYFVAAKTSRTAVFDWLRDRQNWWPFVSESKKEGKICIQVITPARNPKTGEVRHFPTPCDVPEDWEIIPPSDMINEDMEQKWTEEQQKAISIAQPELPRFTLSSGGHLEYMVRDVYPADEGPHTWTVWFSLDASHPPTDTDFYITVDVEKEKVIRVHKPGA